MRIINIIFITFFIGLLALPLLLVDLSSDRFSVRENRLLSARPKLSDIKNHPVKFIREFDKWFKDSTGFRVQFVTLYNNAERNTWLNTVSYSEGYLTFLIGEQGHHYSVHWGQIEKFQGKKYLSDNQLTNMAAKLEEVKTSLNKKGIPLIVMLGTDKESIYPEFYPKSIKRGPEPIQLDVITNYLQEHTTVDIFNIKQALLAEKDNYLLYPLVDNRTAAPRDIAHYTEIGAFFAYRELMNYINIYFPEIIPYELSDIDINYDEIGTPFVSLKTEIVHKKFDPSFFDHVNYDPVRFWGEAYENIEKYLPVLLLMRDSYGNYEYIGKYLAQHFSKVISIHFHNMNYLDEYIEKFKPDIIVFESAERTLIEFASYVPKIPELFILSKK